jgi:hypothetical protein
MTQTATKLTIEQALENIYLSLQNNNTDLDLHIANLKTTLAEAGQKSIMVNPERLALNNRQGRKMMQSYFAKRGVTVEFLAATA